MVEELHGQILMEYWQNYFSQPGWHPVTFPNFVEKEMISIDVIVPDIIQQSLPDNTEHLYLIGLAALMMTLYKRTGKGSLVVSCPLNDSPKATPVFVGSNVDHSSTLILLVNELKQQITRARQYSDYDEDALWKRYSSNTSPHTFRIGFGVQGFNNINAHIGRYVNATIIWKEKGVMQILSTDPLTSKDVLEDLSRDYLQILRLVTADRKVTSGSLSLIGPEDLQWIEEKVNSTVHDVEYTTLINLFERTVSVHAHRIALKFREIELSFSGLNARVNRMARCLTDRYGLLPSNIVALRLEKSDFMIVSIMSILKAGASYLPIEPTVPEERVQFILNDATVALLITDEDSEITHDHVRQISVQQLDNESTAFADTNPDHETDPGDPAYIIYTSGSTGTPKGVIVENHSVVNRIAWMWRQYTFTHNDVILQKTSYSFDVSVWEIFLPLCYGAQLVVCPKEVIMNFAKLAQTIDEYGITAVHFVPSIYALYVARQKNNTVTMSSLRHVFVSGEALKPAVVDAHYQFFDVPLHNLYGPTEATVDVTYYRTAADDKLIPIGRPIDNIQVYILDGDRQLCRPGLVGEIALAGVGLARGYLNRPELTSSKFINVDWSSQRLYLTGDIGRQLESGDTLYMHRADDQVKINGNRIELGEVENTLMIHNNVDLVVCCVNENRERIDFVAFVKLTAGSNVSEADLRQFLEKRIPSYMIPLRFVVVDHIPFTTSGKADKARLIQTSLSLKATGKVNAETDAEKMIFEIWKSVLELDDISVTDNFLMIGGDSVRIVILFEKLELSLPGVFQVHELYNYNTIRAQAGLIESRGLIDAHLTEVAQSIKIDF